MRRRLVVFFTFVLVICMGLGLCACGSLLPQGGGPVSTENQSQQLDYARGELWVSAPKEASKAADAFFILPTVNMKNTEPGNESLANGRDVARFLKTLNAEQGIVADSCNVFCPLYRQMSVGCYLEANGKAALVPKSGDNMSEYANIAYADVRDAFSHYLENLNGGRPIVLFGYSQGAEMVLRLLADYKGDERLMQRMVAAYVVGSSVTEEYLDKNPELKMAQGPDDTGVIVSFNAVDERCDLTGVGKELSINPLNWRTDDAAAKREQNLGYVRVDTNGDVAEEIPAFCGAYIDKATGKLVVTDLQDGDTLYNSDSQYFLKGDYHLYDLSLFYRNLQQNVDERTARFLAASGN